MTYLPEARRQLLDAAERRTRRRIPRSGLGWVVPAVSVAVAIVVAIAFLSIRTQPAPRPATAQSRQLQLVYQAQPTPQVPVLTPQALARTVRQMNLRLSEIPHSHASIRILPGHHILVDVTTRVSAARVEALVGSDAELLFYDWEANVLLPDGRSTASELARRRPLALMLSQGSGATAPGSPRAGAMDLYQAVKLASRQPYSPAADNSRVGTEYYLFAPHSGTLWAGPLDVNTRTPRKAAVRELKQGLPQDEQQTGHVLAVKQGTAVLEAAPNAFRLAPSFGAPGTRYYVLRDHVAVYGSEITRPIVSMDPAGRPDVEFGFTAGGGPAFRHVTAVLAHRGQLDSTGSERLFQHFAVALDNQLIEVPQIDYMQYPDGVSGQGGANLDAVFTRSSARALVKALRLGALPVRLKLVLVR